MYPWLTYEYRRKERSKLSRFLLLLSLLLIAVGLSLTLRSESGGDVSAPVSGASGTESSGTAESSEPSEAEPLETEAAGTSETEAADSSLSAEAAVEPPAYAEPPESVEPPAEPDEPPPSDEGAAAEPPESAEPPAPVEPPASVDVFENDDYFSDALFIGDSRTQGLLLYSNLSNASYYAARGLTVKQVFEKAVIDSGGGKITVSDALSRHERAFGKVYLMFGLNELGWNSADKFIEQYGLVLDKVKETQPGALIYVQAIMPVSAWKSEKDPVHNNPNIDRFNDMIKRLTQEKGAVYLDVGDGVSDESGVLPNEASSDGIHLNKKYCIKWEEYLRTHVL